MKIRQRRRQGVVGFLGYQLLALLFSFSMTLSLVPSLSRAAPLAKYTASCNRNLEGIQLLQSSRANAWYCIDRSADERKGYFNFLFWCFGDESAEGRKTPTTVLVLDQAGKMKEDDARRAIRKAKEYIGVQCAGIAVPSIEQLESQLEDKRSAKMPVTAASSRRIAVQVKLSASPQLELNKPNTLYIFARIPNQPGPPLAVKKYVSAELPLQTELTTGDAMFPGTLAAAQEVEVVALLSFHDSPIARSGDHIGVAAYSFSRKGDRGSVAIEIDQRVP